MKQTKVCNYCGRKVKEWHVREISGYGEIIMCRDCAFDFEMDRDTEKGGRSRDDY